MDEARVPEPLAQLIVAYRSHQEDSQWAERLQDETTFDAAIKSCGARCWQLPEIQRILEAHLGDREITMAIAHALRYGVDGEDEVDAATSIARLLRSPFSRTRYRAAQTAAYRARYSAPSKVKVRVLLWTAAKAALQTEECESVLLTLCEVIAALRAEKKRDLNETEQRIWNLLANRILSAKRMAEMLDLNMDSPQEIEAAEAKVRQTILRMRDKGCQEIKTKPGDGYWRSDAPPNQ